jgi:TonB family protein
MKPIVARAWLTVALLAVLSAPPAAAQTAATIIPIEWAQPIYPQIAQSANVQGDVEVAVDVRPDGAVQNVEVVRGAPLITHAAAMAAKSMRFTCRECGPGVHRYSLYVTFKLSDQDPAAGPAPLIVSPTQGWVTVIAPVRVPMINGGPGRRPPPTRGLKCLFLWRCDPPPQRARSGRCLWLWRCGVGYTYA